MQLATIPPFSNPYDDNRHSQTLCNFVEVEAKVFGGKYFSTTDDEGLKAVNLCVQE